MHGAFTRLAFMVSGWGRMGMPPARRLTHRPIVKQPDPDTCEAIRLIHSHGFCPLVIGKNLVLKHWPPQPAPAELLAALHHRAQEIAECLLNTPA